ncbi:MAG: DUF3817 domain-containing protein [Sulfurovaceae bacterium]|nr:DUF3817 domain-containing protein [Sulfurovaceae bacterium]
MALVEGTTLLMLVFIAVPLKYKLGMPEAVYVMGRIHAMAFVLYVAILIISFSRQKLSFYQFLLGVFAAFIPFGSFVYERKVLEHNLHIN